LIREWGFPPDGLREVGQVEPMGGSLTGCPIQVSYQNFRSRVMPGEYNEAQE
jgi:hypothetical protein